MACPVSLDALDAWVSSVYLVGISSETRCWLQCPVTQEQTYRYRGRGVEPTHLGSWK